MAWACPQKLLNFCEQLFHNYQCKSMLQLNLCLCKAFFGQLEQQTHVPSIHLPQWQQERLKEWENNYGLWKISLLWRCFKWCHTLCPMEFEVVQSYCNSIGTLTKRWLCETTQTQLDNCIKSHQEWIPLFCILPPPSFSNYSLNSHLQSWSFSFEFSSSFLIRN